MIAEWMRNICDQEFELWLSKVSNSPHVRWKMAKNHKISNCNFGLCKLKNFTTICLCEDDFWIIYKMDAENSMKEHSSESNNAMEWKELNWRNLQKRLLAKSVLFKRNFYYRMKRRCWIAKNWRPVLSVEKRRNTITGSFLLFITSISQEA